MQRDVPIFFAGVVIDQYGGSVPGARVHAHVRHFSLIPPFFMATKEVTVETDNVGKFEISGITGSDLFINDITKDGFEFNIDDNSTNDFRYRGADGEYVFSPDINEPVIFKMRLKTEPVFLLEKQGGPSMSPPSATVYYNFIEEFTHAINTQPDMVVTSYYHEESQEYTLVFRAVGLAAGIYASEETTYQAPESGYESEYSITVNRDIRPPRMNLYIRSRDNPIYTRMDVGLYPGKKFVRIDYKSWTNPYGERSLEPDVDLPATEWIRLRDEAIRALKNNRYPEKRA